MSAVREDLAESQPESLEMREMQITVLAAREGSEEMKTYHRLHRNPPLGEEMKYTLFIGWGVMAPAIVGALGVVNLSTGGGALWWFAIAYLLPFLMFYFLGAIVSGIAPSWYKRTVWFKFLVWLAK